MLTKKHIYYAIAVIILGFSAILGNLYYAKIFKSNVSKDGFVYIKSGTTDFHEVENSIRPFLLRTKPFRWVAKKKNYIHRIKPGRYKLFKGMNNNDLVNLLRSGEQTPVKVSFNNQNTFEKLAGSIASQIEADSTALLQIFNDEEFISKNAFTSATALSMYIPNSYELYWNTNANEFQKKMLKQYRKFWNTDRLAKAEKLNLTASQVNTLASIVQKESATVAERKTIAGLYLNRLQNKWPLQADPTIIYAVENNNGHKKIRRVLTKHLKIDSPYNTYKNLGLPPGPIGMPDISSIDAVLNAENHDYYYMCASVTNPGRHVFAKTLSQHNLNARKYQEWVAKQGY